MKRLALAAACLLSVSAVGLAQPAEPPAQYLSVTTVTVRPDAVAEFEEYSQRIREAAAKVSAPGPVNAYQVVSGGPPFTYVFSQPFSRWAEVDGWLSIGETFKKAHGDAEAARLLKGGRATLADVGIEVYRLLADLSTRPARMDPSPYVLVFRTEVRPDKLGEWQDFLRKLKTAQESSASPMAIRRVSVHGPQNTFITVVPFTRFADRDAWPTNLDTMAKAYGAEEAQRIDRMRLGAMERSEIWVLRYRPDLSRPAPTAAR